MSVICDSCARRPRVEGGFGTCPWLVDRLAGLRRARLEGEELFCRHYREGAAPSPTEGHPSLFGDDVGAGRYAPLDDGAERRKDVWA